MKCYFYVVAELWLEIEFSLELDFSLGILLLILMAKEPLLHSALVWLQIGLLVPRHLYS